MLTSSFIGKRLITPAGENLGYVLGVRLSRDRRKLSCLLCADGEEEEFFLPARAVLYDSDALVVRKTRISSPTGILPPVMTPVYTHTGELLGTAADFRFGDEDPALIARKDGTETVCPLPNLCWGETVVLHPRPVTKPSGKKQTKKQPDEAPADKPQLETMPAAPEPLPVSRPAETEEPARTTGTDYSFNRLNLLGRKLKKSVFDGYGSPIAVAGERITPAIISAARRHNRLLQLTVNTLTNVL